MFIFLSTVTFIILKVLKKLLISNEKRRNIEAFSLIENSKSKLTYRGETKVCVGYGFSFIYTSNSTGCHGFYSLKTIITMNIRIRFSFNSLDSTLIVKILGHPKTSHCYTHRRNSNCKSTFEMHH